MTVTTAVDVSLLGIVAATIGYQALGALWYGPVFGSRWMDAMGYADSADVPGENATAGYAITAVGSLVAVTLLGVLIDWVGATTLTEGLVVGALVGVGFVATTGLQSVPFEERPWSVYLLSAGYNVVALAGAGALLGLL